MFRYLSMLTALSLFGACSSHVVKKSPTPYKLSGNWLEIIKTKKPGKPKAERRVPASNNIPGFKTFISALKAHPNALKAPVGHEVLKGSFSIYEGEEYRYEEKTVYLKENRFGYFSLVTHSDDGSESFDIYDSENIHEVEATLLEQGHIKEIKKISESQFKLTFKVEPFFESCEVDLDLTKSLELSSTICKDTNGKTVSEDKVISVKEVNVQDFKDKLTAVKANVTSNILRCDYSTVNDEVPCYDTVTDESEKDWSYILK